MSTGKCLHGQFTHRLTNLWHRAPLLIMPLGLSPCTVWWELRIVLRQAFEQVWLEPVACLTTSLVREE